MCLAPIGMKGSSNTMQKQSWKRKTRQIASRSSTCLDDNLKRHSDGSWSSRDWITSPVGRGAGMLHKQRETEKSVGTEQRGEENNELLL